jgi:hypothetical protein
MTHRACRIATLIGIVSEMKPANRRDVTRSWTDSPLPAAGEPQPTAGRIEQAEGTECQVATERRAGSERRDRVDRRRRFWWSAIYGSFNPRRRAPQRRTQDSRFHPLDLHSTHLMAVAVGILLLSVADAFMTVTLLAGGAIEVNPVMAAFVYKSAALFASIKMGLTGIGVTAMVFLARYRFMRKIPVETMMYAVLVGYAALLGYEYWMLETPLDLPRL